MLMKFFRNAHKYIRATLDYEAVLSCKSPEHLRIFINQGYDIKKHDLKCLIAYENSKYMLAIENDDDIPINNLYDPSNGKLIVVYELEPKTKFGTRID